MSSLISFRAPVSILGVRSGQEIYYLTVILFERVLRRQEEELQRHCELQWYYQFFQYKLNKTIVILTVRKKKRILTCLFEGSSLSAVVVCK